MIPAELTAAGLDRNGIGARSAGLAGASLADETDALGSISGNPAALGFLDGADFTLSGSYVRANGNVRSASGQTGSLVDTFGVLPDLALRVPLSDDLGVALSFYPDTSRLAKWSLFDPPGGADGGTSYGQRNFESEILNLRTGVSAGYRFHETLSVGAGLSVVYRRNELRSAYVFQSFAPFAGLKTALDLEADGWGVQGDFSIQWKPDPEWSMVLAYRTPAKFNTSGTARGDIDEQFKSLGLTGVPTDFRYDVDITSRLPQKVSLAAQWKATDRLRISPQIEWIEWSRAFDTLEVRLSNGSNPVINSVGGGDAFQDDTALNWRDSFVYRLGVEYDLTSQFTVRAGYAYSKSPVPDSTLLPMTAAISEHTLAAGLGWKWDRYRVDVAYQYDLPATRTATATEITGTEFRNSRVELDAHWVSLAVGMEF